MCLHASQARAASHPVMGTILSAWVYRLSLLALSGLCAGVCEAPSAAKTVLALHPAQPSVFPRLPGHGQPGWSSINQQGWRRTQLVLSLNILRGGSGLASLEHQDVFSRNLEKKLGGRSKAKKSLANHGFGKLMDDLDRIAGAITSTDSRGQSRDKLGHRRESVDKIASATNTHSSPTRGAADFRSADPCSSDSGDTFAASKKRSGFKLRLNAPQSLQAVRERAVAGGIDTKGLFVSHQASANAVHVGSEESLVNGGAPADQLDEHGSAGDAYGQVGDAGHEGLEPEVARLVNIARFASTRPAQSARTFPHEASIPYVPTRLERQSVADSKPGFGFEAGLTGLETAVETSRMTGAMDAGRLDAAVNLENASLTDVAQYWQQNFNDLMKLDRLGTKRKKADQGRGRGLDHIPSAIAPLLSIPAAEDRNTEDLMKSPWYRQGMALQHIKTISSLQAQTGRPCFMDIISKPGWDQTVQDVYHIDNDWNIIPPQGPELAPASISKCSLDASSRYHSRHGASGKRSCDAQGKPGRPRVNIREDVAEGSDGIDNKEVDARILKENSIDWKEGEQELHVEKLMDADLADDWAQTLHHLEDLQHKTAEPAVLDELLPLVEHIQGKAAAAIGVELSDQIAELAKALAQKWKVQLLPTVEKEMALDNIVLPRPKIGKAKKTYAEVKERLRMAGLPTGGKKRKILQRLKALDEKEARALQDTDKDEPNNEQPNAPQDGGDSRDSELQEEENSYEPSQVDERFAAIYTDPDYALDPSHQDFSFVKGRSHHAQKKYHDLKRLITQDRARRSKLATTQGAHGVQDGAVPAESLDDLVNRAKCATERLHGREGGTRPQRNADADAQRLLWGSSTESDKSTDEEEQSGKHRVEDVTENFQMQDSSMLDPSGDERSKSEKGEKLDFRKRTKAQKEKERRKRQRERLLAHPLHRMRILRSRLATQATTPLPETESNAEGETDASSGCGQTDEINATKQLSKARRKRLKILGQRSAKLLTAGVIGGRNLTASNGVQGDMHKLHGFFQRGLLQGGLTGALPGPSLAKGSRHSRLRYSASSWNLADVKEWVRRVSHHNFGTTAAAYYVEIFDSFEITGKELVTLTDIDLQGMGVKSKNHRTHLLTLISKLSSRPSANQTDTGEIRNEANCTQLAALCQLAAEKEISDFLGSEVAVPRNSLPVSLPRFDDERMRGAQLVDWKEELKNSSIALDMPKRPKDIKRLPDDELFDNPVDRDLPCAPLPTVETPFGTLRIYNKQDLIRENSHLNLEGPCPFDCACCVI